MSHLIDLPARRTPDIIVKRFWTEFRPDPADPAAMRSIDWCEYAPFASDKSTVVEKVSRLSAVIIDAPTNIGAAMAAHRWRQIEPHYRAWKSGQAMPEAGTPLAAWNGVSPEQADVLRTRGVKTVEDVASLTDTHIGGIPLPGMRTLVEMAKRFLAAQDANRLSASLAAKDDEIATLQARLDELAESVAAKADMVEAAPQGRRRTAA